MPDNVYTSQHPFVLSNPFHFLTAELQVSQVFSFSEDQVKKENRNILANSAGLV
jgi:hypothetical protein